MSDLGSGPARIGGAPGISEDERTELERLSAEAIRKSLRALLVMGLVVAVRAFLTGPSVTAVQIRSAPGSALAWIRTSGGHAGPSTGPAGRWTYAHRTGLRICALALAAILLVFWGQPTALDVINLAILLLVILGLIELFGRPSARPKTAGSA